MTWFTGLMVYAIIWWVVLFAVLPWGVRPQGADGVPGTDPGAPMASRIVAKLIWTTVVASVVFAVCAVVYAKGLVTLDGLTGWMGMPRQGQ